MATVALSRSDRYPVGTTVGIYPAGARRDQAPPTAAAIATGTVDAAGALSVANAGIVAGASYVAYAAVSGEHRYVTARTTADTFDAGGATGTGTTTSGSKALTSVTATTGAFREGQIITGPGIPPQTRVDTVSGGTVTMDDKATASAAGVALVAYGAFTPRAKGRQRRAAVGTS